MAGERHGRGMLCVNPPLFSHIRLDVFPSGFATKIQYAFLSPALIILTVFVEEYKA
jgi:hypothetical protein